MIPVDQAVPRLIQIYLSGTLYSSTLRLTTYRTEPSLKAITIYRYAEHLRNRLSTLWLNNFGINITRHFSCVEIFDCVFTECEQRGS